MPPKAATTSTNTPSFGDIYEAADAKAFSSLKTLKEFVVDGIGLNLVRFKAGEPLDWLVDLSARYEPREDRQAVLKRVRQEMEMEDEEGAESGDEDEDEDEDMDANEDSGSDDDQEESDDDGNSFGGIESDEDEDEVMASPPLASSAKRKSTKPPAKKKKVSFDPPSKTGPAATSTKSKPTPKTIPGQSTKNVKAKQALKVANQPASSNKVNTAPETPGSSDAPYDFSAHFGA